MPMALRRTYLSVLNGQPRLWQEPKMSESGYQAVKPPATFAWRRTCTIFCIPSPLSEELTAKLIVYPFRGIRKVSHAPE